MNKQEFLENLRNGLAGLSQEDVEERLAFYGEMIDDRMEEGLSEEDAILHIGSVEQIVTQSIADTTVKTRVKEKIKPKKQMGAWEIVLLILGSPIWLSLLIAGMAVIFSLYVSLWSVIISLWSVFGAFIGCSFGSIVSGIIFAYTGHELIGVAMLGAALVCVGLSIFAFYGCKAATKGILLLTKKMAVWTKRCLMKKEEAQ